MPEVRSGFQVPEMAGKFVVVNPPDTEEPVRRVKLLPTTGANALVSVTFKVLPESRATVPETSSRK